VELRTGEVPYSWSNDPGMLGVNEEYDVYKKAMMEDYNIPDTRPILTSNASCWYLVEGGDKKYYLWNAISDNMVRIEEPS
jgi:hypothetical protein